MNCLLCHSPQIDAFKVLKKPEGDYFHCAQCDLIFKHPSQRLSPVQEKERYDKHDESGPGHQAFLAPLVDEVHSLLTKAGIDLLKVQILDYGCGPQQILSVLFAHKGLQTTNYDLYYKPDQDSLRRNYHVVTSTEVWEHFPNPREEIQRQIRITKPGGLLAVMTSAHKGEAAFHDWYYRRDPTHITFFSEKTMEWIAKEFKLLIMKAKSPYWIFQKM